MLVQYVIRWDHLVSYGSDYTELCKDRYSYLEEIRCSPCARGCLFRYPQAGAMKFSSWAEAAAVAAFIIHHINEMYEEALDIVKVDL